MAADYIVNYNCPVKQEFGAQGLIRLVKQEMYAHFYIRTYMQQDGISQEEAMDKTMSVVVQRPEGDTMKETTVRNALQEVAQLNPFRSHCKDCPVGNGYDFGCYQSINYPISRKAEEWLGSLIEINLKEGLDKAPLLKLIVDNNVNGQHYANLRVNFAGKILESSKPVPVVYKKSFFGKKSINTNQVFELLIGMQELSPDLAALLAAFGGERRAIHVIEDASKVDEEFIEGTMSGKVKPSRIEFTVHPGDTNDRSISQLMEYFKSLSKAAEHNCSVTLDA